MPFPQSWAAFAAVFDRVAETPLILENAFVKVVAVVPDRCTKPVTSQLPAVRDIEVTFAGVAVVSETAEPLSMEELINSPTEPAAALSFVAVPTMFGVVSVLFVKVSVPASVASVPVIIGSVRTGLPATAAGVMIAVPLVLPAR